MSVYNKRGILLLPKVIVLNPKDGDEPMNGGGGNMEQGYSLYKRG